MSTDARQKSGTSLHATDAQSQLGEPAGLSTDAVEVLIRLPDLRKRQAGAESKSPGPQNEDKGGSAGASSNSSGLLGPFIDTLRHRWSTWKSAAMFAQAGVLSRTLVVAGLVLGMVIAAYVLMIKKEKPSETSGDADNTAQNPAPVGSAPQVNHLTAPRQNVNQAGVNSTRNQTGRNWAAVRLDQSAPERPPQRAERGEADRRKSNQPKPTIEINNPPLQDRRVYSADARNHTDAVRSSDVSNRYQERAATQSAQRPSYGRYDNSAPRGYQGGDQRMNTTNRNSRDVYRSPQQDYRYAPSNNSSNPPPRAGFRGTIEPAPYRSR